MPLKTLSFNQGIMFQNIRSLSWIGIIYFLILLFVLPLQFILAYNNGSNQYVHYYKDNLFAIMEPIQIFVMFIIPVLLAVVLFRYLHIRGSADFFHSLPIKREVIYAQHVLFGLFTLSIPVLVIGTILTVFYDSLHVFSTISITEIWNWVVVTLLFNYFVFFTSTFVAMVTGISAVHAVITYIFFVLPVGVYAFFILNLEYFLFGFSSQYYLNTNTELLVPFVRAAELARVPLTGKEALAYSSITIMLAILTLVIYRIRRIESAQQAIAFQNLQPLFKYGVAFCCLLIGGFYFGESQDQFEWVLFGMIAAAIIGFFAAEMVLHKTWRVFKEWKGFVYFITVFAIIGMTFHLTSANYEENLPDLTNVKRVYLGDSTMFIKNDIDRSNYEFNTNTNFYLKEKENIQKVYEIHKTIVEGRSNLKGIPIYNTRSVVIGYELQNGSVMVREYTIPLEFYYSQFASTFETEEYKYNHFPLLSLKDAGEIKRIAFQPNGPVSNNLVLTDETKIKELITILQDEMRNELGTTILKPQETWAYIEMSSSQKIPYQVEWKKSYQKVEEWLKENGLLNNARITADSISKMIVAKNENAFNRDAMSKYDAPGVELERIAKQDGTLVITDKAKIEESLRKATWYEEGEYIVGYYFNDENIEPMLHSFSNENLPEFVREHFK